MTFDILLPVNVKVKFCDESEEKKVFIISLVQILLAVIKLYITLCLKGIFFFFKLNEPGRQKGEKLNSWQ